MNRSWSALDPRAVFLCGVKHRHLVFQMARREILGRYRGSSFGSTWAIIQPLLMLVVYTYVFGMVFQGRWPMRTGGALDFACLLFAGLIVFTLFSEVVLRAPTLVLYNANLVKKVVFPIEILPWVAVTTALFNAAVSTAILVCALFLANGSLPWTALGAPLLLAPMVVLVLGLSWFLSALGVFLRDIGQVIGTVVAALMFLGPVFYSISTAPEFVRPFLYLNPVTIPIEAFRSAVITGELPQSWAAFGIYLFVALATAMVGFAGFQRSRKAFPDVL